MTDRPTLPGEVNPRQDPLGGMSPSGRKALLVKVKVAAVKDLALRLLRWARKRQR